MNRPPLKGGEWLEPSGRVRVLAARLFHAQVESDCNHAIIAIGMDYNEQRRSDEKVTAIGILQWALFGAVLLLIFSPWHWPNWAGFMAAMAWLVGLYWWVQFIHRYYRSKDEEHGD